MSLSSRRELLNRLVPRYRSSSWKEKRRILDEFVSGSGYHRKYAVTVLNHGIRGAAHKKKMPPRFYDEAVRLALITAWKAANHICSKLGSGERSHKVALLTVCQAWAKKLLIRCLGNKQPYGRNPKTASSSGWPAGP